MQKTEDQKLYALTLVGNGLPTDQLKEIHLFLNAQGLKIETIRRLSSPFSLKGPPEDYCLAGFDFLIRTFPDIIKGLRPELKTICDKYGLEVCIQEQDASRQNKKLIAFDLDSTLIQMEAIDELAALAGKKQEVSRITELAMQGSLDFKQSLIRRVALLKGLEKSALGQVANSLTLTPGAQRLIARLKNLGYKTATLSGGFTYFARLVQERLGLDYVFANELEISEDKLTGNLKGELIDGQAKARLLKEIAAREGICLNETIAVGDGANDLPMLESAGLGLAFHPKALLKARVEHSICHLGLDSILYFLGLKDTNPLTENQKL